MSFDSKVSGSALDTKSLKRVFSLISDHKIILVISIILTIALALIGIATPVITQRAIDQDIMHFNGQGLLNDAMLIIVILVLQTLILYFQTYYTNWLGQQAVHQLRTRIFNHILDFRLKVYDRTPVGTMITRTVSDVETIADIFSEGLVSISGDVLLIIAILTVMFYEDWRLSCYSLSVFPLLLISAYIFKEKVKVSFQDVRTQVGRLNAFLQEHITGMQIVQVFNRQDIEMNRFEKINAAHRDANIRGVLYYSVFFPVIEVLSAMAIAFIVWGGTHGILTGRVSIGMVTLFIMLINQLFRPIRQVADKFNTLQMGMVAADRIFNVLEMEDAIPDNGQMMADKVEGKIEFRDVWFAYEDENWILKDLSFDIQPGQTLAIVGHTGAGKTSITNLVNRLYEKQKGEILLDGRPVEDYQLTSLRKQIAVVLQDVFLLSDSIANNIKLFNENITREQMIAAARLVGADRFIETLPGGYDYQVQERGATLSTGQRQLISFIRAVIQNPRILILDEATSSIDQETEELIQHATEVLLKDRTSIVIAHRLATIQHADKILVMEKGRIKEVGTHHELLEKGGLYRKLYELQFTELVM
jgi:ATP-binding cassette subfamily B protein